MARIDTPSHVRELCRRLQPMIGNQAERIWQAYVIENETGKEQILEYLELLTAQHFHGQIGDETAELIPPGKEEAFGSYVLGAVTYNHKELYPFGLREGEWIHHAAIFGRTGAGKTNLGLLMIQRLKEMKKPFCVFDWKRNYRDLIRLPGFDDLAVYTIGRPVSPLRFNPLIPPKETHPKTWIKKLVSVVAQAYLLGDGVIYLLQEALDRVYEEAGVYEGRVSRWPTFQDVLQALKTRPSAGREAGWMSSALRALGSLTFGEMDVLLNQGSDDLGELLQRPVILELDALTQSDKVFFIQAMLLWIHHQRMSEPTREVFKHAILIEEAHHVLSGERQSLVGGQSIMDLTFREIREFGESMILLDQHPSQISLSAMGNSYSTFAFNLKSRADVSAMSQAMLLKDEEKDLFGKTAVGHAVVRLQGRGAGAFTIKVPEFPIQKGTVRDADVVYRMTRLGLLSTREQPARLPGVPMPGLGFSSKQQQSEAAVPTPDESLAKAVRAFPPPLSEPHRGFLADVARYPESGIAERYMRLGFSVRQGQKAKEELVKQGLLAEELQTTRKGKMRVIRLTENGSVLLGGAAR